MRMYVILSDGDTWDGLEGCRVVLAKEEHEVEADIEYNPKNHIFKTIDLDELASGVFDSESES